MKGINCKNVIGNLIAMCQNLFEKTRVEFWIVLGFGFGLIAGGAMDGGLSIPTFMTFGLIGVLCFWLGVLRQEEEET